MPCAVLWPNGDIEEVHDARGARLLAGAPDLAHYAFALARSSVERAAFVWVQPPGPWMLVSLACVRPRGDDLVAAMVELDPKDSPPYLLTPRELDILTLLCGGLTNPEIADRLHTSRKTVATHVEHVLAKLGQRHRAGAAALALDCGLLRLPIPGGPSGFEHLAIGAIEACARARGLAGEARISLVGNRRDPPPMVGRAVAHEAPIGSDRRDEALNGSNLAIAKVNQPGDETSRALALAMRDEIRQLALHAEDATSWGRAEVACELAHIAMRALTEDRAATIVGWELWFEAARRPELLPLAQSWSDAWLVFFARILQAFGASGSSDEARLFSAAFDGLLIEQLGRTRRDSETKLAALLERLLGAFLNRGE
jgi:DNA-binding CsgD family transcriptional regulator